MGPNSAIVFVVAVLAVLALLICVDRLSQLVLKIVAGLLAFALSMTCGVLAVNDYYGYYTSWGAAFADLKGDSNSYVVTQAAGQLQQQHGSTGRLVRVQLRGADSHIDRSGLVYLPTQYFSPTYRHDRFPVLLLLHGTPGNPAQWVTAGRAPLIEQSLVDHHRMGPVVLVMPDSNGGVTSAQECLNTSRFKDDTYISHDVPADVRARFRVSFDPGQWGLLGASSGGYCAANLMFRDRSSFGAAAAIDGYFRPQDGTAGSIIGADQALARRNDPLATAQATRPGQAPLVPFWVAVGTGEHSDYVYSQGMVAAMRRLEQVPFLIMRGARHNFAAVRRALPGALSWSWQQLCTPDERRLFPVLPVDSIPGR